MRTHVRTKTIWQKFWMKKFFKVIENNLHSGETDHTSFRGPWGSEKWCYLTYFYFIPNLQFNNFFIYVLLLDSILWRPWDFGWKSIKTLYLLRWLFCYWSRACWHSLQPQENKCVLHLPGSWICGRVKHNSCNSNFFLLLACRLYCDLWTQRWLFLHQSKYQSSDCLSFEDSCSSRMGDAVSVLDPG